MFRLKFFETEAKAQAFMLFNNSEIEAVNGYVPIRSYFCIVCGGWHLTSRIGDGHVKINTEKVLKLYENAKKLKEERHIQKLLQEKEKKEILEKLIAFAERKVQNIEFSNDKIHYCKSIIDDTFVILEQINGIKANFRGSNRRKRELEIKLHDTIPRSV